MFKPERMTNISDDEMRMIADSLKLFNTEDYPSICRFVTPKVCALYGYQLPEVKWNDEYPFPKLDSVMPIDLPQIMEQNKAFADCRYRKVNALNKLLYKWTGIPVLIRFVTTPERFQVVDKKICDIIDTIRLKGTPQFDQMSGYGSKYQLFHDLLTVLPEFYYRGMFLNHKYFDTDDSYEQYRGLNVPGIFQVVDNYISEPLRKVIEREPVTNDDIANMKTGCMRCSSAWGAPIYYPSKIMQYFFGEACTFDPSQIMYELAADAVDYDGCNPILEETTFQPTYHYNFDGSTDWIIESCGFDDRELLHRIRHAHSILNLDESTNFSLSSRDLMDVRESLEEDSKLVVAFYQSHNELNCVHVLESGEYRFALYETGDNYIYGFDVMNPDDPATMTLEKTNHEYRIKPVEI